MLYDIKPCKNTIPKMSSQRFCLRWNNHQSNLLSVFDQLLHAETFTDVTLAVEGQLLKAHKMVLSACSPYFQALFLNHPEKHPIVILKDVPYSDMKCLLDFMYRGEVSVDQDRLTAFLRVAESLRIKGLTEVNEEKCDIPAITNSLLQQQTLTAPPQLHRIHPYMAQRQKQQQHNILMNPLLGNALMQPKRKRGRPRKLSGSSNGIPGVTNNQADPGVREDYDRLGGLGDRLIQGSPEMLEVKMGMDNFQTSGGSGNEASNDENSMVMRTTGPDDDEMTDKETSENTEPMAGTSKENSPKKNTGKEDSVENSTELLIPKLEPLEIRPYVPQQEQKIRVNPLTQTATTSNSNALQPGCNQSPNRQYQTDNINNNNNINSTVAAQQPQLTPGGAPRNTRRRARRRANSTSNDPAEQLTEMSVRGLNLFRYASVNEGIYQCTECAKENIQKTFKNKYSFQRHAFLYHEGTQRKVFPCPVCQKEFSRPDKMKNHMKTTHECYMPKDCLPMGMFFQNQIEAQQQIEQIQVQPSLVMDGVEQQNSIMLPPSIPPGPIDNRPFQA